MKQSDYGANEEFIERVREKFVSVQVANKLANDSGSSGADNTQLFTVKNSIVDPTGVNAVVLEGLRKDELENFNEVIKVFPDLPVSVTAYSWGIDRLDQQSLPLSGRYNSALKGCGVDIYIIDTGIDTNHIEFAIAEFNRTVVNIFNAYGAVTSNTDRYGHGTHCAGNIDSFNCIQHSFLWLSVVPRKLGTAGGNTIGTAPCSNIYGLKALNDGGSGYSSEIISALNVVKQRHLANPNAKSVVSMSLGGNCDSTPCVDNPVNQVISSMHAVGILFSVAAGNNYRSDSCNYFPSSSPDAITVAASDQGDNLASYSNVGSCVDIIGPGSAVNSACAKGFGSSTCLDDVSYKIYSGTSMSTPHVAGTLAQLLEKHRSSFNSSADIVKGALLCDAAKNKIQGIPLGSTPNLLVQIPHDDHTLNKCLPTAVPSSGPTVLPTTSRQPLVPSVSPTGPSQIPSTKRPSVAPSYRPTLAPTTCFLM